MHKETSVLNDIIIYCKHTLKDLKINKYQNIIKALTSFCNVFC